MSDAVLDAVPSAPLRAAVVIAFPGTKAAEARAAARLQRALAGLVRATQEQQEAVAQWRANLASLRTAMSGLSASVQTYRTALAGTQECVAGLREQAMQLAQTASRM